MQNARRRGHHARGAHVEGKTESFSFDTNPEFVIRHCRRLSAARVVTAEADARGIPTIAPLIDAVDDAVVNIAVVSERPAQLSPLFRDPFFQPFLPPLDRMPPQRQMSAGSGVIVDAREGNALTNNHVVEGAVP